jgi:leader peptidase (prepilin peptidase)/N-methyltransferase
VVFDEPNIVPYLLSAVGAAGFLGLLYLITKGKGMGFGDVKLAAFMGLFLGYPKIIGAFYIAFIVGAVIGLILMIFKKANRKTQIPFGPFLILGTTIAWWWGDFFFKLVFGIE